MSTATYEQLVAAGAPRLPAGVFYRVRLDLNPISGERLKVQLRKHAPISMRPSRSIILGEVARAALYRRIFDDGVIREEAITDPVGRVAELCREVVAAHAQELAALETLTALKSLEGDHP